MRDPVKTAVAALASGYFLWAAFHPEDWRFVDNFNLVMHEAGHILFIPFGQFMTIAGGSLFQVIVPAVFALYFYHHKKQFSCALLLFLVGESLVNVSVYAGDAVLMQLPLLGGDDSIHDWNWMLDRLNLLARTREIAGAIRAMGVLVILSASVLSFIHARKDMKAEPLD
ncbi:MAG TPA: hypothetical protein VJS44_21310 [Pyrinomonadaceae bacterium]|nr:hypothetical protein [Pyrinomonadaceae bacterium]